MHVRVGVWVWVYMSMCRRRCVLSGAASVPSVAATATPTAHPFGTWR